MNIYEYMNIKDEKPLDNIVADGGYCGIFRSIGAIGDSLASGEFEAVEENGGRSYHDCFDFSWGQYLARMAGTTVTNFSRGGMTAKEFCCSFGEKHDYFNKKYACAAYIVALGVNDCMNQGMPVGTVNDINTENPSDHPDTFAGWYGELVLRYRQISPGAKFFFVSIPKDEGFADRIKVAAQVRDLLDDMTKLFDNSYLIDLWQYAPAYDREFRNKFFLLGHMNPMGYMFTAKMFASYIDYIIRKNPDEFRTAGYIPVQFIETNL